VPQALAASQVKYRGEAGRVWIASLPQLAATYLDRWQLRLDGPPRHGLVALVLPVLLPDGTPAAVKLQPIDDEHAGEGAALRTWNGQGAVRLLDEDPATWTLLLERLDADCSLACLADDMQAVQIIRDILRRLSMHAAPPGVRTLGALAVAWTIGRVLQNALWDIEDGHHKLDPLRS
jgi:streptomycin 6-kinase